MTSTSTECLVKKYYTTLFDPGQFTCVSKDAFGKTLVLVDGIDIDHPTYKNLQYVSINAMRDARLDANVVCFRNILVENDKVSLQEQWDIVKKLGLPWSTATFSGNKSIHFIISLEVPLPTRDDYDFAVKWLYNVLEPYQFDIKTKNPSRFSRVPGGTNVKFNEEGVQYHSKHQKLMFVNGRVSNDTMQDWLLSFPEAQPKIKVYDSAKKLSETAVPSWLNHWTQWLLDEGIFKGKRNEEFFKMAFDFYECGFDVEEAINYVQSHAKNLDDFPRKEIDTSFRSAYKTCERREP